VAGLQGHQRGDWFAAGEERDSERILRFVDSNIGCCKQHVYVFDPPPDVGVPDRLVDSDKVRDATDHGLFIIRSQYSVVLKNPLEEATLDFMWPVRVDVVERYWAVRFVVLEKNLTSYFARPYYLGGRTVEEKSVLQWLVNEYGLVPADLHKGVKALWAEDFMDSYRAEYRKPGRPQETSWTRNSESRRTIRICTRCSWSRRCSTPCFS
jgi:hypothetical protein